MAGYFVVLSSSERGPDRYFCCDTAREASYRALKERARFSGDVYVADETKRRLSACELYKRLSAENWQLRAIENSSSTFETLLL